MKASRATRTGAAIFLMCMALSAQRPAAGASSFAQLEGARVHYQSEGTGEIPLVLVHGWSCDGTVWDANAAALAKHARVITIDLPGHGQSDKPEIVYTMNLHARAIAAVLDDAGVKSATLVGHSLGTAGIRQFYRLHPERVHALVVVDGALRPFGDAAMLERFIAPLRGADYEQALGRSIDGMTQQMKDESLRAAIKATVLQTPQHVAVSEMEATLDPSLWQPDKIDVPVLMILAKSPMWSADYERFVRSFIPKLRYETWENVSHFLMMEKPAEFNVAVAAFLNENGLANR